MKFNEDTRVKIPATIQFLRLGYEYQSLRDADIDSETKIFINRFRPAIERINNHKFSNQEIKNLLSEMNTVIKNNDMGKEFYQWIINPVDKVKLFDFENINNNNFAVVNELYFGELEKGSFRPDVNVLINGVNGKYFSIILGK